jgi:hypothetical protein
MSEAREDLAALEKVSRCLRWKRDFANRYVTLGLRGGRSRDQRWRGGLGVLDVIRRMRSTVMEKRHMSLGALPCCRVV